MRPPLSLSICHSERKIVSYEIIVTKLLFLSEWIGWLEPTTFSCPDMNALDGGFLPPREVSIVEKPYLKAEKVV